MSETYTFPNACDHCGGIHSGVCPRIKSIERYPDGTIKRVEYHDRLPVADYHAPTWPTWPIYSNPPPPRGTLTIPPSHGFTVCSVGAKT